MFRKKKIWKDRLTKEEALDYDIATINLYRNPTFENCMKFAKKYDKMAARLDLEEPGSSAMIVSNLNISFRKVMFDYSKDDIKKAFKQFKSVSGVVTIFLYKMLCGLANMTGIINRDIDFLLEVLPLVKGKGNKQMICQTIDNIQYDIEFDNMLEGRFRSLN